MSRIGRAPIPVPGGVNVTIEPELVRVDGPARPRCQERIPRDITVTREEESLFVRRPTDRGEHRALHGLVRTLVEHGRRRHRRLREAARDPGRRLPRADAGSDLELALGYSHPVNVLAPEGIEFEVPAPTRVVVRGNSKQQVGELAAYIRKQRPPEPYKGKGIRYEGEVVTRKVGKRA